MGFDLEDFWVAVAVAVAVALLVELGFEAVEELFEEALEREVEVRSREVADEELGRRRCFLVGGSDMGVLGGSLRE